MKNHLKGHGVIKYLIYHGEVARFFYFYNYNLDLRSYGQLLYLFFTNTYKASNSTNKIVEYSHKNIKRLFMYQILCSFDVEYDIKGLIIEHDISF